MNTFGALLERFIGEVRIMPDSPTNGELAKALLQSFQNHHEVLCSTIRARLHDVEEDVKDMNKEVASIKGGIKTLMWLLPLLCALGSFVGSLLMGGR